MLNNFPAFSTSVHERFKQLQTYGGELYVVDTLDLFDAYLAAFPEGTNPIFRERTEHDCSCCKAFIRNIGNVVAIHEDNVRTVWDNWMDLPHPYNVVGKALADLVRQAPIRSVWRTKEGQYGNEFTNELLDDLTTRRWDHFWGETPKAQRTDTPDKARGDINTRVHVLQRGLKELSLDALDTVIDLAEAGNLYKGDEFLPAIKGFRALKVAYHATDDQNLLVWSNQADPSARFRNTAIGTLIQDLSEGKELEWAVKSYETKVAPTNYKRPTALVTPKMVEAGLAKLDELGLREAATERRHARIEDVSVNDVLFVDNAVAGKMKDSLADALLSGTAKPLTKIDKATPISAEDFFANIVPKAKSISALVENRLGGNFVSITAGAAGLFRWDNGFSWSYDGDVADSTMAQRVAAAGGRVDGVLRFTHMWNDVGRNASLMDLHVFMPGCNHSPSKTGDTYGRGRRVGWNHRQDTQSGGIQDVDYTSPAPSGYVPVENITFPDLARLPEGDYEFKIHNWALRSPTTSGFKAEIALGGELHQYDHPAPLGNKEWVHLATATLRAGQWTIVHHHPTTTSSRKKWGIDTETLVPVDTLMLSPNFWLDQQIGNKHWFFILRDAKNPDPVRGIYNEYLRPDLDEHRKVFELLGAKTKAPFADAQLSGLGFSSTQRNTLKVVVDGRAFEISF